MHEIESWAEEKRSAYLYRIVASSERLPLRQSMKMVSGFFSKNS
jgi:hypothetical protein